jgi:hypothetical protein
VYAPALVAFVGGGGGFHFSASFGVGAGVAWFPLGPGEVFVPSYHVSRAYVNQVNVTNTVVNITKVTNVYNTYTTTNINNTTVNRITYVNQASVTVVSRDTFVNARPVARNVVAVKASEIAQAPISHMSGAEPIRGSVMGAGKPTTVAPPRAVVNRQVVAQHAPAQPPVPFAQRQDKLAVRPVAPVTQPVNRPVTQPVNRPEVPINKAAPAPVERPVPSSPQPEVARPQPARAPVVYTNDEARPQPPAQPAAKPAPPPGPQPSPQPGWSHPQARPAPPVQPKSESQARDEETKYKNWQAKPQPAKPQPAKPQPAKQAPPKDNKKK